MRASCTQIAFVFLALWVATGCNAILGIRELVGGDAGTSAGEMPGGGKDAAGGRGAPSTFDWALSSGNVAAGARR